MQHLPSLPCYLNGEFTLLPDAKISVMDRGFIFGDGVYEVVPVYAGQPFRFAQHMARLVQPTAEQRAQGVPCVTADDFRWEKAHIKSTSLLGSVFARQIGVDAAAVETVMFRDGYLSEAASSNVWVVKNGTVLGPPRDNLVLEGVRYGLIEALCAEQGIPFELRRIHRDEVLAADELLLSSATKEVLPVATLDGIPVGNGLPGPVYRALYAGYQLAKAQQPKQHSHIATSTN